MLTKEDEYQALSRQLEMIGQQKMELEGTGVLKTGFTTIVKVM